MWLLVGYQGNSNGILCFNFCIQAQLQIELDYPSNEISSSLSICFPSCGSLFVNVTLIILCEWNFAPYDAIALASL